MKLKTLKKGYYWGCKYQINNAKYDEAIQYLNNLRGLNPSIDCKEQVESL